jgi:hypothetical protein
MNDLESIHSVLHNFMEMRKCFVLLEYSLTLCIILMILGKQKVFHHIEVNSTYNRDVLYIFLLL